MILISRGSWRGRRSVLSMVHSSWRRSLCPEVRLVSWDAGKWVGENRFRESLVQLSSHPRAVLESLDYSSASLQAISIWAA